MKSKQLLKEFLFRSPVFSPKGAVAGSFELQSWNEKTNPSNKRRTTNIHPFAISNLSLCGPCSRDWNWQPYRRKM